MTALSLLVSQALASCAAGTALPVVVRIDGFRDRDGQVRVRLFGGPPSSYYDKRRVLFRVEVPVPAKGPVELCVPGPRPGVYVVDVRHDENGNGRTDRQDGGGVSGNPRLSLFDVIFGRKPAPATVQFRVDHGVTVVPVRLMYLQGTTFRPVTDAR